MPESIVGKLRELGEYEFAEARALARSRGAARMEEEEEEEEGFIQNHTGEGPDSHPMGPARDNQNWEESSTQKRGNSRVCTNAMFVGQISRPFPLRGEDANTSS